MSLEYLLEVKRADDLEVLAGAGALLGFFCLRRRPKLGLGLLLFLIVLAPVSNLVPVNMILNERYTPASR